MNLKLILTSAALACGILACAQEHQQGNKTANEHMHQSSVDELIKRFESSERDAYQQPEKVVAYLGDLHGKRIMDLGAGSGYFSVRLAQAGAHVIAADVDEEFQAALARRIQENGLRNIELRKLPYDDPELKAGEVDILFLVNTYHHIEDRPAYFAKAKKGLKANGELVTIDFYKAEIPVGPPVDHKLSIDQAITELKAAGFTRFMVNVELLPYQYIIRAQ